MRKLLFATSFIFLTTLCLPFLGLEIEHFPPSSPYFESPPPEYYVSVRADVLIFTLMYPIGDVDPISGNFHLAPTFDINSLLLGLGIKLPLDPIFIRGAAYVNYGKMMEFPSTGTLHVFGKLGGGFKVLFLCLKGGIRWYYILEPSTTNFFLSPEEWYVSLGLCF